MPLIRDYARIGLVHFMAWPEMMKGEGPFVDTLSKLALDPYFEVVEISHVKDPGQAREVASLLAESGLDVAFGAQPILLGQKLNLNALDQAERQKAVDAVKATFEQAAAFGAESVAVLAGPWDPVSTREHVAALVQSLTELSKGAKDFGLDLALEVFDDAIDKKVLLGKTPLVVQVAREVTAQVSNFGILHDLSHLPLIGETAQQALPPVADYLTHVHIGNAVVKDPAHPAYGDHHPRFGIPGGENDVPEVTEFLKVLFEIGFFRGGHRPILSFELKAQPGEKIEHVIANGKRTLNAADAHLSQLSSVSSSSCCHEH